MTTKRYSTEKKVYAQIRFFEELQVVKGPDGEVLFTGSEEMAKKVLRLLNKDYKSGRVRKKARRK